MIEQRPGQKIFTVPGPEWGVRVIQPAAMPADWWDPDGSIEAANPGIQMWPVRAINTPGTPWSGGPTNYLDTRSSLRDPLPMPGGLLGEGNGAVPWAAATGWGFVAAALQYFDTGILPGNLWTVLIQYTAAATAAWTVLGGATSAGPARRFYVAPGGPASVFYGHGPSLGVAPVLAAGNLGMAGPNGYRNGIFDAALGIFGPLLVDSLYIGCLNNAGVPGQYVAANVESAVVYDATLTAPQMLTVATAMGQL